MLANSLLLVAVWVVLGICAWVGWGWKDGLRRFLYGKRDARAPRAPCFWQLSNVEPCGFTFYAVGGMVVVSGRRLRDRDQINISAISMLANSLLLVAIWVAWGFVLGLGGVGRMACGAFYTASGTLAPPGHRAFWQLSIAHYSTINYSLSTINTSLSPSGRL